MFKVGFLSNGRTITPSVQINVLSHYSAIHTNDTFTLNVHYDYLNEFSGSLNAIVLPDRFVSLTFEYNPKIEFAQSNPLFLSLTNLENGKLAVSALKPGSACHYTLSGCSNELAELKENIIKANANRLNAGESVGDNTEQCKRVLNNFFEIANTILRATNHTDYVLKAVTKSFEYEAEIFANIIAINSANNSSSPAPK